MIVTSKELADHCWQYIDAVCNVNPATDRQEILTFLAALLKRELNLIEVKDPSRNK